MAKIKRPILFSRHFKIGSAKLRSLGAINPALNVDTALFIDPLLLAHSNQEEIREAAEKAYKEYFSDIIKLLVACKRPDDSDICWKEAAKRLKFKEVKGTCLGYGTQSISGSALGPQLQAKVLQTAWEIVQKGVTDPDLFCLLPLLEEGMGSDRISDMTTNIILPYLSSYTERVVSHFDQIPVEDFDINGKMYKLPVNPFLRSRTPVLLVPNDVVRSLPISLSYQDIDDVCQHNETLRKKINDHIGKIWFEKLTEATKNHDKRELRDFVLDEKTRLEVMIDALKQVPPISYDIDRDPEGVHRWLLVGETIAESEPFYLEPPTEPTLAELKRIVLSIVAQFKNLVENKGLWKEVWDGTKRRPEKSIQRIFFAIADTYCQTNDIDISPEVDSGTGPVDFKFSQGYTARYLVEVKLSDNPKLVPGYQKQLEAYKLAESTTAASYLVVEVNDITEKRKDISRISGEFLKGGTQPSLVHYVNARPQQSASKR